MLAIHSLLRRCVEMELDTSDADMGDKENTEVRKKHFCSGNSVFSHANPSLWSGCVQSENVVGLLVKNQRRLNLSWAKTQQ